MAMGREGEVQGDLMISWGEMPRSPGHVFYDGLQKLLAEAGFDAFVEEVCKPYMRRGWALRRCRLAVISACI